jgi:hypothetical protein
VATINIYNSLRNSINLQTYMPVTDQVAGGPGGDADLNLERTRYVRMPFWSGFTSANPASTLLTNHIIFPACV